MTLQQDLGAIRSKVMRPILPQEFAPWNAFTQDFQDLTTLAAYPMTDPLYMSWVTVREYDVPQQKRAVAAYFALQSNSDIAEAFIRYRFLINNSQYWSYQAPPFSFGNLNTPSRIWIQMEQQTKLTLQLQSLDDTIPYVMATRLVLWTWDTAPHPRDTGA